MRISISLTALTILTALGLWAQGNADPALSGVTAAVDTAGLAATPPAATEASAQIALLGELVKEHIVKREQARALDQTDKTNWEDGLIQELRARITVLMKGLAVGNETQPATNQGPIRPLPKALQGTNGVNRGEAAYLAALDSRIAQVRQEFASTMEASGTYALELQTNNTPDSVATISRLLEVNRRDARTLERELADLELRKLEFDAIKK